MLNQKALDKLNQAIDNVQLVITHVEDSPTANQMYLAKCLKDDIALIPYHNFVKAFLSKGKQLRDSQKYLKEGNLKLDKSIGIFNLPAMFTCPNSKDCQKDCYAVGPQNRYATCRVSRFVNLLAVMYYPDFVASNIVKQVRRRGIKVVRIHESGDFYSKTYEKMWFSIAVELQAECKFYYYTKSDNTSVLDVLPNTNKVESMLPDGSINFGSIEYCFKKAKELNIAICPVTKGHKDIRCGLTCTMCHGAEHMLFVQHKG